MPYAKLVEENVFTHICEVVKLKTPTWGRGTITRNPQGHYTLRKHKPKIKTRTLEEPHSMSLIFALLQKDYIVLAADSRHTRGDRSGGLYRNDQGIKTVEVLRGHAVLGFAGHDFGENLLSQATRTGKLDADKTLEQVAHDFAAFARDEYDKQYSVIDDRNFQPTIEFLLAGWSRALDGSMVATAYTHRLPNEVSCVESTYPFRWFEIIGKSCHGALYALHRFGIQELPIDAALRLSVFALREVCEQDTSTGGSSQIYVLKSGARVVRQNAAEIGELEQIAKAAGEQLGNLLLRRN
jgi:hypothetical protein